MRIAMKMTSTLHTRSLAAGRRMITRSHLMISFAFLVLCASITDAQTAAARTPISVQPIKGSLVIVGGGGTPDTVWKRFMQLAGGDTARIVQIQTADANADST